MPNKNLASFQQLNTNELALSGQVNLANAPALASQLAQQLASATRKKIELNLSQAAGGSALVAVLLAGLRAAKEHQLQLVFTQPTASLSEILALSNLTFLLKATAS